MQSSSRLLQRFKNPAEGTEQGAVDNLGYQRLVQRKLGSKKARKEVLAAESQAGEGGAVVSVISVSSLSRRLLVAAKKLVPLKARR